MQILVILLGAFLAFAGIFFAIYGVGEFFFEEKKKRNMLLGGFYLALSIIIFIIIFTVFAPWAGNDSAKNSNKNFLTKDVPQLKVFYSTVDEYYDEYDFYGDVTSLRVFKNKGSILNHNNSYNDTNYNVSKVPTGAVINLYTVRGSASLKLLLILKKGEITSIDCRIKYGDFVTLRNAKSLTTCNKIKQIILKP